MAHGKIRVNTLTYDTGSGDVDVAVSGIPTASDLSGKVNTSDIGTTVQGFDTATAKTERSPKLYKSTAACSRASDLCIQHLD